MSGLKSANVSWMHIAGRWISQESKRKHCASKRNFWCWNTNKHTVNSDKLRVYFRPSQFYISNRVWLRTVARRTESGEGVRCVSVPSPERQKVFNRGALHSESLMKTTLIYSVSYLNLRGLGALFGGAKPTKAPLWWCDWSGSSSASVSVALRNKFCKLKKSISAEWHDKRPAQTTWHIGAAMAPISHNTQKQQETNRIQQVFW